MIKHTFTLEIVNDSDPQSPREWDNIGLVALSHSRHNFPNDAGINWNDFSSHDEVKQYLKKEKKALCILPVQMYDHSSVSLYVGTTHDKWDGGQLGYIYTTREQCAKMGTTYNKKKIEKILINEVDLYSQYVNGDVYGYQIKNEDGTVVDSCYGFFGDDAKLEGNNQLQYFQAEELKRQQSTLKAKIIHKVPLAAR